MPRLNGGELKPACRALEFVQGQADDEVHPLGQCARPLPWGACTSDPDTGSDARGWIGGNATVSADQQVALVA
jgi:hypothetical protein